MRFALVAVIACLCLGGCASDVPAPTASPPPQPSLLPLPANMAGIPQPGDPSALIPPHTPRGELEAGVARNYALGHCGLLSPIDIDGNLWDPIGGHDGGGGALTDDQIGELINSTPTVVLLTGPNTLELRTPLGALVTLARHDGPRRYFLCD